MDDLQCAPALCGLVEGEGKESVAGLIDVHADSLIIAMATEPMREPGTPVSRSEPITSISAFEASADREAAGRPDSRLVVISRPGWRFRSSSEVRLRRVSAHRRCHPG